jgi:hypothetical protein
LSEVFKKPLNQLVYMDYFLLCCVKMCY